MPSLHVDAPCSLLVLSCGGPSLSGAGGHGGLQAPGPWAATSPELRSPPLHGPCPTDLRTLWSAHRFGENKGIAHEV